jgi:signal transduction histidine kinase
MRWALPPRGLLGLVAGMMIVPLALLSWLGWRTLEQDNLLESQQMRQRLELSADLLVAALQRALTADAQRLAAGAREWPDGAVAVEFTAGVARAYPRDGIAYLPAVAALPEAGASRFAQGEALEFRGDHTAAVRVFRELASSSDPAVQAGAWLRLARNLRAIGRLEEALAAYGGLADMDGVSVDGVPAGLVARYGRAKLLERAGRATELSAEAERLGHDLRTGRWALTGPVYWLYARDAARWSGDVEPGTPWEGEVLAEAAEALWVKRGSMAPSGQAALLLSGQTVSVLWLTPPGSFYALVAAPRFAESRWLAAAGSLASEQGVAFRLLGVGGRPWLGATPADATVKTTRRSGETGLPWDLAVASAGALDLRQGFAQRRSLMVVGLALAVLWSLTASILVVLAVSRELAVARLKSDFVAAVSHEFRTPLTSLRQFTDMLREHEHVSDERRRVCYDAQSRATDRLTRLVESLLDFGRMEAGSRRYRLERREGAAFVRGVVEEFRQDVKDAGYVIDCVSDGSVYIEADEEALSRALWNLLDNAVKYSPDNRAIEVRTARRGVHFTIAVRDNGIGIPRDEQASVRAKFHRGREAQRLGIKGTGIGLAIVEQIVAAHGGRLELDSEQGVGSAFTIVLPAKE